MLNFPIVDTHVHLWDPKRLRYPWLDDIPLLNKPYLLDDFKRACGPVQVGKMVFEQCECELPQYKDEADWGTGLAKQDASLQEIVRWDPLGKGDEDRAEEEGVPPIRLLKGE